MTPQEEQQAAEADGRAWEQDDSNPDAGRCSRPLEPVHYPENAHWQSMTPDQCRAELNRRNP